MRADAIGKWPRDEFSLPDEMVDREHEPLSPPRTATP